MRLKLLKLDLQAVKFLLWNMNESEKIYNKCNYLISKTTNKGEYADMNFINGILVSTLFLSGGTGLTLFSQESLENSKTTIQDQMIVEMETFMDNRNVTFDEMQKFMQNGNINFGQMKPFMSEIHPNLDNQEQEDLYESMHGTGGAVQSRNFRGMHQGM